MPPKNKTSHIPAELEGSAKLSDVNALEERVIVLEAKLSDPKQLSVVLETAATDSKSLDKLFSKIFCDMMDKDEDVKKSIEKHVASVDRNVLKRFGGKIALAIWSIALLILGSYLRKWLG